MPDTAVARSPRELKLSFNYREAVFFGYDGDYFFEHLNDHLHGASTILAELMALAPDAVIWDVGANIGTTALSAAYLLPQSKVLSFEPGPRALDCLQRMIKANGLEQQCEVVPAAVGARAGTIRFAETDFLAGSHVDLGALKGEVATGLTVPVVSLDEVVRQRRPERIDLLKIDVEGYEQQVLEGARELIARYKPRIVMEYSAFGTVVNCNGSPLDLAQLMLDIAGEFTAQFPWGDSRVHDAESLRHFIFANMKIGAQDVAFSPK